MPLTGVTPICAHGMAISTVYPLSVSVLALRVPWSRTALRQVPFQVDERGRQYSVSGDGDKFLFPEQVERTSPPITVVLNWTAALKR